MPRSAPRDERLERLTQQQRLVWGHPQELLQLHNGHVCATSGQQSPGFETAELHLQQVAFERRRSTGVDASADDVPLSPRRSHELVGDHDVPNCRRGDAVLHPHLRDQHSLAIGDGQLRRLQPALRCLHAPRTPEEIQRPLDPDAGQVVGTPGLVAALECERRIRAKAALLLQSSCGLDVRPHGTQRWFALERARDRRVESQARALVDVLRCQRRWREFLGREQEPRARLLRSMNVMIRRGVLIAHFPGNWRTRGRQGRPIRR